MEDDEGSSIFGTEDLGTGGEIEVTRKKGAAPDVRGLAFGVSEVTPGGGGEGALDFNSTETCYIGAFRSVEGRPQNLRSFSTSHYTRTPCIGDLIHGDAM